MVSQKIPAAMALLKATRLVKNPGTRATLLRVTVSFLPAGEVTVILTVPYAFIGYVVDPEMR